MKIRIGFVSNSFSTSYVIALARDFKTTQAKMQEFIDSCNKYEREEKNMLTLERADKVVEEIVEALCSQAIIWDEHDSPPEYTYNFVRTFGDEIGVVNIDGGPEDGKYVNLFADECKDKHIKMFERIMQKQ